ncbi:MAG: hypothetical protein JJE52_08400 [Acidimicrobiia bacterium]|nr:hypothetical protein [Acidimicrobiia bacterium]
MLGACSDEAWIAQGPDGDITVGIATSTGGGSTAPFESGSPVKRSILVVDADETPPAEIFFDDGRLVQLHAIVDCEIVRVTDPADDAAIEPLTRVTCGDLRMEDDGLTLPG